MLWRVAVLSGVQIYIIFLTPNRKDDKKMNAVQEAVAKIEEERVATFNRIDQQGKSLLHDIESLQSAYIAGFFLDAEQDYEFDDSYRKAAFVAAAFLVTQPGTDNNAVDYLLEQLGTIAGDSGNNFQGEAKNLLLDIATDSINEEVRQAAKNRIKALK